MLPFYQSPLLRPLPRLFLPCTKVLLLVLFICGDPLNAETNKDEDGKQSAAPPATTTLDAGQLRRGEILFLQCRACHSTDAADGHLVGPNLAGLFGSNAGSKEGFVYSEALANSDVVWTTETLDEFLLDPGLYFAGTKMAFVGIPDSADRRLLVDWLELQVTP